jgi:putative iron-regulated protein
MSMLVSRRRSLAVFGLLPLGMGLAGALLEACKIEPDKPDADRQEVLRDLVSVVILPTLRALRDNSLALVKALEGLEAEPTAQHLSRAQQAFAAARSPWKQSEAFYFGPVQDIEITGDVIDSWPADGAKLEKLVSGAAPVDADAVASLGANLRGFPGLEQLLFDRVEGDETVLARLTEAGTGERRLELATSLGRDLAQKCEALGEAWGDRKKGYAHELAEAGVDSKVFERQRDGIDEVVTGMLYLAELMVMRKFAKPLGVDSDGEPKPELEEAPRSDGSLDALRDNLRGLQAVYLGKYGKKTGHSLSAEVADANPDVDKRFKQVLQEALDAVDAVPGSFRESLVTDSAPIEAAYQKVRAIKNAIAMELAGTLGASIGFGYSDTD